MNPDLIYLCWWPYSYHLRYFNGYFQESAWSKFHWPMPGELWVYVKVYSAFLQGYSDLELTHRVSVSNKKSSEKTWCTFWTNEGPLPCPTSVYTEMAERDNNVIRAMVAEPAYPPPCMPVPQGAQTDTACSIPGLNIVAITLKGK